jgi:hypothetical protein
MLNLYEKFRSRLNMLNPTPFVPKVPPLSELTNLRKEFASEGLFEVINSLIAKTKVLQNGGFLSKGCLITIDSEIAKLNVHCKRHKGKNLRDSFYYGDGSVSDLSDPFCLTNYDSGVQNLIRYLEMK